MAGDGRWKYGIPPPGNANFAWVQHFIHHLAPRGVAGFVLSKGSLTSKSSNEDVIRKNIVEEGLVDCIVNLPGKTVPEHANPRLPVVHLGKRHGYNGERKRNDEILSWTPANWGA